MAKLSRAAMRSKRAPFSTTNARNKTPAVLRTQARARARAQAAADEQEDDPEQEGDSEQEDGPEQEDDSEQEEDVEQEDDAVVQEPNYIRIGTRSKNSKSSRSEDQLDMEAVIVAQKNRHNNGVKFYEIESWYLFNISIGHCGLGDAFTDINDMLGEPDWKPDNLFAGIDDVKDLRARVLEVMDRQVLSMHEYRQDPDLSEEEAQRLVDGKLIRPPIHPALSEDYAPTHDIPVGGDDDIHAVVFFLNNALNKPDLKKANLQDLTLPLNLQVTVDHNETYKTFTTYLLDGEGDYLGLKHWLKNETADGGLPFWLKVAIWVVPQSTDRDQELIAYRWRDEPNRQAHEFLDPNADDRRLYFEVVIGVDGNSDAKNKEWYAKLKAAGAAPGKKSAAPRKRKAVAATKAKAKPTGVTKTSGVARKKSVAHARPTLTGSQAPRKSAPGGPNKKR